MFTGGKHNLEFIRHIYKVDKVLKSYTIYGLLHCSNPLRLKLSDKVRLEPFRGKSNTTGAAAILRGRELKKWAKQTITGLRPTHRPKVYYGDHVNNSKNLLLFQISDNGQVLTVDYFNGFNPSNPSMLKMIVEAHDFDNDKPDI